MSGDAPEETDAAGLMALPRKIWLSSLMRRGSCWGPTLLLLLAYLILHGASNLIFLESRTVPRRAGASIFTPGHLPNKVGFPNPDSRPLRIFMYDLPRKFTFGVVENYLLSREKLPKRSHSEPVADSDLNYPGNQHSAEWWLFYDLQQPQGLRLSESTVRVLDPEQADVFYVPFFSSLSLIVGNGKLESSSYSDEQMQDELIEWLDTQETWTRNGGRDHVIVCQDPNALYKLRTRLRNSVLLLSDFGRFRPGEASLVKDVVLPYSHRVNTYESENSTLERNTLLFFLGNRYRKEGGKVRDQLFQVLDSEPDMVIKHGTQSREGRRAAASGMRESKFCLHPAGDTPSACRLFDAIVSVCVPVIVSDEIELPFEDELDYSEFSVFVPTQRALEPGFLGSLLRNVSSLELQQKQQRLREVRLYFEYHARGGAVEMIWQQVRNKLPLIRAMINRDRRLVVDSNTDQNNNCKLAFL